jgi:long-chain acyl-CoA synthetase
VNLAGIIEPHDDRSVATISGGRPTTYGELRQHVDSMRGALDGMGIGPDDRVGLLLPNSTAFAVSYLAVLGTGAVAVPMNPASPAAEIQRELAATRATTVVVAPPAHDAFRAVDRAALTVEHVIAGDGAHIDGAERLDRLVARRRKSPPARDRARDDVAVLMFTAGTSGPPRAAMLTHGNLLANIEQVQAHPGRALTADDVCLGVLPFFHIFGLNVTLGLSLSAGAAIVVEQRFDPVATLEEIRFHQVTVVAGAPPMYAAWAAPDLGVDPTAMETVRLAVSGAARLPEEVAAAFETRFHIKVSEGYGLTEASPVVTSSAGDEPRPGSIGVPLPGVDVRLVDEEGEDALVGDPGEIWVRGPNVFAGYLDDEATTARVLAGGWLRTGDIAVADDDGYLYLVDRAKDLIIVSGFNVYPAEVEEALLVHPGVAEACVVGVADEITGEAVKAFVVAGSGHQLDEDELRAACAERLARYKCPTAITVVDEIPRGLAGKALRRALR